MKAIEILSAEHRVIERVLACLEIMAGNCEREGKLDARPARQAVDFFRNFADRCHHAKEESRLFPLMEARGFPAESGPTAAMRHEHIQGRELVGKMEGAIAAAAAGETSGVEEYLAATHGYINLLRGHIEKEDHCLFPMADQALSEEDQRELLKSFEEVEHSDLPEGIHETYLDLADSLAKQFEVPSTEPIPAETIPQTSIV